VVKKILQALLLVSLVSAFVVSGIRASEPGPLVQCVYSNGTCIDHGCLGGSCMLLGNNGPCGCVR
jgi:hypothetical protein